MMTSFDHKGVFLGVSIGTKSPCWDARNVLWARWLRETIKILNSYSQYKANSRRF